MGVIRAVDREAERRLAEQVLLLTIRDVLAPQLTQRGFFALAQRCVSATAFDELAGTLRAAVQLGPATARSDDSGAALEALRHAATTGRAGLAGAAERADAAWRHASLCHANHLRAALVAARRAEMHLVALEALS